MKKLSLLLDSEKNEVYLDGFIRTRFNSKMKVRNAAVYGNFRNVTENFNDTVTLTSKNVTFVEGYWTFHMMAEKLGERNVKLDGNRYDNTCKIFSKNSDVNLKSLGPMLGFPKDTTVQANTWKTSPSNVDVNLGLRCVTVECSSVDTDRNFDRYGKRNKVIATLPVTTEQSLNYSVTHYRDLTSEVAIMNGDHNLFEFKVGTNLEKEADLKVMLELYLE